MQRKLAAILAIDMVGFTRLMAIDEPGTLQRWRELRTELIDPRIAQFGGRIVKEMGDGLLVDFASVVDGANCAYITQCAISDRSDDRDDQIQFRMGLNLGDIIVDNDDIFGDGVNIAARIEALAEPGSVLVSESAYHQLRGKTDLQFEDLGDQELKNVTDPLRVYRIAGTSATKPKTAPAMLSRPAVAVLPLTNMSGDDEQEYFSDGLTEDIITALSYCRTFPVIARNSTFVYKGKSVDPRKVAQELGARYLLEGSVRKAGNRVRVTVQLIDAKSGHHVWAEKYDRELVEIFELQDELTQSIAAIIEPAITLAEQSRAKANAASDVDAWDLYLRATDCMNRFTAEADREARDLFKQALEIDPSYAQASCGIAMTYLHGIFLKNVENHDAAVVNVVEAAKQAVRLDDNHSDAHLALGLGYMWSREHDKAVAEVRRALECNPSSALSHVILGNVLDVAGEPEQGIPHLQLGLRLNPLEPRRHYAMTWLAGAFLNARNYSEALDQLNNAISRQTDYPLTHLFKAVCNYYLKNWPEAELSLQECEALESGFASQFIRWRAYKKEADNEHMIVPLQKLGVEA